MIVGQILDSVKIWMGGVAGGEVRGAAAHSVYGTQNSESRWSHA
jgi:hypothetical protein